MTNRILPETLPALYRKHGVVPVVGSFGYLSKDNGRPHACGIGVTYYSEHGNFGPADDDEYRRKLARDGHYVGGYVLGWDDAGNETVGLHAYGEKPPLWALGYADGAAGWEAVKDLAVANAASG